MRQPDGADGDEGEGVATPKNDVELRGHVGHGGVVRARVPRGMATKQSEFLMLFCAF